MSNLAWIEAMHEELHQFHRLKVWKLVDKPFGKTVTKLKWLWKNKKDEDQTVIHNKMDVKTDFLNDPLKEKVYVAQPDRTSDPPIPTRYKRRCCSLIPAESSSLPYAHVKTTKTYYKHQNSRIKKAQELKTKTSANCDIKDPSSETKLWGRLLQNFQEDAKYEYVGQDMRSQDGKDDKDKQGKDLKISESRTKPKDNYKG
nr:hypothetical protein [Tanacetum cinerariifolium]